MYYTLYCEDVESEVDLSPFGLIATKNPKPQTIRVDFIRQAQNKLKNYLNHQTNSNNEYGYYFFEDLALFEIFSGNRIFVRYFNEIDNDLIHTMLNYPFAILFNQRKRFVIHASCVLYNGKVFCFCGKTQSGKSSLAAFLIKKGGILISEDTCVFDNEDKDFCVVPSYNFLKISDEVNIYKNNSLRKPLVFKKKSIDRKGYILQESQFYKKPIKVDYFIYLDWSEESFKFKKLDNRTSFKMLLSNELVSFSKENALYKFKAASNLVSQAQHFSYSRTKELKSLDNFIEIFLNETL